MNITVTKSASFICNASGFGSIKIFWKRDNYSLPATATNITVPATASVTKDRALINEFSSTLNIPEIIGYYSGQYYCVAENEAGTSTSQRVYLHVDESK